MMIREKSFRDLLKWIIGRICGSEWAVVYVGEKPPVNPVSGFLWIDVSGGQFVLKSYDGRNWRVVQGELQWDKVDGGSL